MLLLIPMHDQASSHRQKVKGSASDVQARADHREEDYWRGLTADIDREYAAWLLRRREEGTLTIEIPKTPAMHRADYVKGQGPQTHLDATDKSHTEPLPTPDAFNHLKDAPESLTEDQP